MRYERSLQVRLQERYRRLAKTNFGSYLAELGYFRDFVSNQPVLVAILQSALNAARDFDSAAWASEHLRGMEVDWPASETERAIFVWHLVSSTTDQNTLLNIAYSISGETAFDESLQSMTSHLIEPFIEFLQARLGSTSDALYALERFKTWVEWFERDRLFQAYESDTAVGEGVYDLELRRFLFLEGVNDVISTAKSASGRADLVAGLSSDDSIVADVKLFDGASRGVPDVSRGVRQVWHYAQDYNRTAAHLVIINLTDTDLELPTDGEPAVWPPRLQVAGVTIYLVVVRGLPPAASASKLGPSAPRVVARSELVRAFEEDAIDGQGSPTFTSEARNMGGP